MSAPAPSAQRTSKLREYLPMIALLALMFVARSSFANHYVVPSGSMESALVPGDRVFVDMTAYGVRVPFTETVVISRGEPARGDVVLLPSPADGTRLIKRIVGVEGDRVTIVAGRLSLNGVPATVGPSGAYEQIGRHRVLVNLQSGGGPDVDLVIPEGHVFVVGDHRGNSHDSRMFGLVREQSVYARAEGVYWRSGEGVVWKDL